VDGGPAGPPSDAANNNPGASANSTGNKGSDNNAGGGGTTTGGLTFAAEGTTRTILLNAGGTGTGEGGTGGSNSNPGGTPSQGSPGLVTTNQQLLIASASGIVGSQPPTEILGEDLLIPEFLFTFTGDDKLQDWEYIKDAGQELFPSQAKMDEVSFQDGPHTTICPGIAKCEGRVLRWFDLGPMPGNFTDAAPYLAHLRAGHLSQKDVNSQVAFQDFVVGSGNVVTLAKLPAVTSHVYFLLLAPEGTSASTGTITMNAQSGDWDKFQGMVTSKDYHVVRGFTVKSPLTVSPVILQSPAFQINPSTNTSNLLVLPPGGSH